MRRLMIAAACMALAGACTPAGVPGPTTPGSTVATVALEGTRALYMAELAYNSIAGTANAVVKACLATPSLPCPISGQRATQLRELNRKATMALKTGKAAQSTAAKATQADILFGLVDEIKGLIGR